VVVDGNGKVTHVTRSAGIGAPRNQIEVLAAVRQAAAMPQA